MLLEKMDTAKDGMNVKDAIASYNSEFPDVAALHIKPLISLESRVLVYLLFYCPFYLLGGKQILNMTFVMWTFSSAKQI